jgi:hypothetical protein
MEVGGYEIRDSSFEFRDSGYDVGKWLYGKVEGRR